MKTFDIKGFFLDGGEYTELQGIPADQVRFDSDLGTLVADRPYGTLLVSNLQLSLANLKPR